MAIPMDPALLTQFAAALAVALIARRMRWLTTSGAWAAAAVGGAVFTFAGWPGAYLLLTFFISSSLLSKLPGPGGGFASDGGRPAARGTCSPSAADSSARVITHGGAKGPRDGRQVLANGLAAALAAVWMAAAGDLAGDLAGGGGDLATRGARLALAGVFAAATADTWATEIGAWLGGTPRSALTARPMRIGESGGMTVGGTFAGMAGAALVGWVAALAWGDFGVQEAAAVEVAGFAGMWIDSLLGASLQYRAYCPLCAHAVEEPRHRHAVTHPRGLRWLDNHGVNLVATVSGGVLAWYLGRVVFG